MRRDPQALRATMAFASIAFDCMVSGDLADNRVLFMLIGLLEPDQREARPAGVAPEELEHLLRDGAGGKRR